MPEVWRMEHLRCRKRGNSEPLAYRRKLYNTGKVKHGPHYYTDGCWDGRPYYGSRGYAPVTRIKPQTRCGVLLEQAPFWWSSSVSATRAGFIARLAEWEQAGWGWAVYRMRSNNVRIDQRQVIFNPSLSLARQEVSLTDGPEPIYELHR